jgi:hypothetical protein
MLQNPNSRSCAAFTYNAMNGYVLSSAEELPTAIATPVEKPNEGTERC